MEIDVTLEGMKKDIEYIREKMDEIIKCNIKMDERITALENWKLVFVTKFSMYSTIGLVVGSFAAQIVLRYLDKWL